MGKRILGSILIVLIVFSACVTISFAAENTSCGVKLKYKSESLYRGKTLKNKLVGAKGTVKWKSSNSKIATVSSKGVITAKTLGKCTISATYKGKTYKCKIKVIRRLPDYDAKIVDVDHNSSGKRYVKVRIRNFSSKPLTIQQKAKYNDMTSVTYEMKLSSSKRITIKAKKTETVTFYNYGKYELYNFAGRKDPDIFAFLQSSLRYNITFDGKSYSAFTYWYEEEYDYDTVYGYESLFKKGNRMVSTEADDR